MSKINLLYKYTIWELYIYNVRNFRQSSKEYNDFFVKDVLGKFIAYISPMFHDNDRICWELYSSIYYITKESPNFNIEYIYLSSALENVHTYQTSYILHDYYFMYLYVTFQTILSKCIKKTDIEEPHSARSSTAEDNQKRILSIKRSFRFSRTSSKNLRLSEFELKPKEIESVNYRKWNDKELICLDIFNQNCDKYG